MKNPILHSRWVEEINKHVPVKFVPCKDSLLCSEHFSADMFYINDGCRQKAKLKPFAVPTMFPERGQVCSIYLFSLYDI